MNCDNRFERYRKNINKKIQEYQQNNHDTEYKRQLYVQMKKNYIDKVLYMQRMLSLEHFDIVRYITFKMTFLDPTIEYCYAKIDGRNNEQRFEILCPHPLEFLTVYNWEDLHAYKYVEI